MPTLYESSCARRTNENALGAGYPGVFTGNASKHALPFHEAPGFVRSAPMQVAQVLYNPMRFEIGSTSAAAVGTGFVAPA
ncbi:MAG TPA: hypothetical protein VF793_06980 [Telluria sp.]